MVKDNMLCYVSPAMNTFRLLQDKLLNAARAFPSVVVTGPRRSGKTWMLRHAFPHAEWVLLEDPSVLARARSDPRTFLDGLRLPVILDEIQNFPELFAYIRARIDHSPNSRGQYLITGSQEFALMRGVTESMAGRAAILQLLPFGVEESPYVSVLAGGFPEALAAGSERELWFSSYVQTFIERDVRHALDVADIATFRRFLLLVATRTGQLWNRSDLAAPLGVSIPTINRWMAVLELTGQVILVPPWFESLGKRLVKAPRLYLADTGLACHLLGIRTPDELERSPFLGPLFESHVASELVKHQIHRGRRRELYGFRDQRGLEVDFLIPGPSARPILVEVKATATPMPRDATGVRSLRQSLGPGDGPDYVVHRGAADSSGGLAPGVSAVSLGELLAALDARGL